MPRSRIDPLPDDQAVAAAEALDLPGYVTALNVNRVLLRHPTAAGNFVRYFWDLVYEGVLDPRLRELAVMRIAWRTGSAYEWTQHWHLARGEGVPEDDLVGVRDWHEHASFGDADRAVLRVVDDVIDAGAVSDDAWAALERHLDETERLELLVAVTGWRMVASLLLSLHVPLEDGLEPWPPDGVSPTAT